ncbi:MAG: LacI family transcriptional regulator [Anaerohalosphaeraceae bacterium]|nr:LacI family transcriptional regulator [Anaerohalosphaeraceae bacterium]
MATTIYDIARELDVSHSTVSRALRDNPTVASATRRRIKEQALKMRYKPNLLARGLVNGKTQMIGFLTGSIYLEMVSAAAMVASNALRKAGYDMQITATEGRFKPTQHCANDLVARGVDGLIVRGVFPNITAEQMQEHFQFPAPTVFTSAVQLPFPCRQVCHDEAAGVTEIMEHLYGLGHRHIYMLSGLWEGWKKYPVFQGFYKNTAKYNLGNAREKIHKAPESFFDENGRRIYDTEVLTVWIKKFLQSHPDCTAIFCTSPKIALMLLSILPRLGVRVPEDISVVSSGDITGASCSHPQLSVVSLPLGKMMRTAVELLLDGIENDDNKPAKVIMPTKFIIRQSTEKVRSKARIKLKN